MNQNASIDLKLNKLFYYSQMPQKPEWLNKNRWQIAQRLRWSWLPLACSPRTTCNIGGFTHPMKTSQDYCCFTSARATHGRKLTLLQLFPVRSVFLVTALFLPHRRPLSIFDSNIYIYIRGNFVLFLCSTNTVYRYFCKDIGYYFLLECCLESVESNILSTYPKGSTL